MVMNIWFTTFNVGTLPPMALMIDEILIIIFFSILFH